MEHNMLKWLVIYILNKLALYLYEGELCFKVIERKYNMAANENFGHWFNCHKQTRPEVSKLTPEHKINS